MYKIEVRAEIDEKGKLTTADNFKKLLPMMDAGNYILSLIKEREPKTIDEYRAEYFAKRDIVAEDSGNTKQAIHEWAKTCFLDSKSTTLLTEKEWRVFIDKFKAGTYEHFNCYL